MNKAKYKAMLKKDKPSKKDLKTFNEAVKNYKAMFPNWRDENIY